MKIYLAGPMTGYPEFNFPVFLTAAAKLRDAGHKVWSPAEHDISNGLDVTGLDGSPESLAGTGFDLRKALGADLAWITSSAEAVIVLPGWEHSSGAWAEVATALALRLPVWTLGAFLAAGDRAERIERMHMLGLLRAAS
jgi:hypothetical protein